MYNHKKFLLKLSKKLYTYLDISNKILMGNGSFIDLICQYSKELPKYQDVIDDVIGKVIKMSYSVDYSGKVTSHTILMKITGYDTNKGLIGDGFSYRYRNSLIDGYYRNMSINIDINSFKKLGGYVINADIVGEKEFKSKIIRLLSYSRTSL